MVSTFTPNIQLEEPARGDYVGTWDTPVNANMTLLDLRMGGTTYIALNNSPVTLAAAQFQASHIVFNSTLTGSVQITFPTSFVGPYTVENLCTGTSAFTITLKTTNAGGNYIGLKPGDVCDIFNDGASIKYRNLGPVGSFVDFVGSSVPAWVTACAIPPYLNCDGTSFSSATYPVLATLLGGTTLPDSRGRVRAALNQTTGRLTSSEGGVDGNTNLSGGGSVSATLGTSNLPAYTPAGSVTVNSLGIKTRGGSALNSNDPNSVFEGNSANTLSNPNNGVFTSASVSFTGTAQGGVSDPVNIVQPTYVAGITMIRAA